MASEETANKPEGEAASSADPPQNTEVATLKQQLETITAERDKLKDVYLRAMADMDNLRKRGLKDREEARQKAREDFLREFLPVFDNLERAAKHAQSASDVVAVSKGIELVLRLFEDTLNRQNGRRIKTVGQPFDPQVHEALQQLESEQYPAGVIAHEEVAGYQLNDRLVRPAMVVVSRGPGPSKTESESKPEAENP